VKRILLDVDGVSANFLGRTFEMLAYHGGPAHTADDLQEWAIEHLLGTEHDDLLRRIWHSEGFVACLNAYPGAVSGTQALRDAGHEVYFVTTAMHDAKHWMWERYYWLKRELGADGHDILFAAHKHLVVGDVFVDDKPANVLKWQQAHPKGASVLWAQPWNRSATFGEAGRTSSWEDILHLANHMT